MKIILKVKYLCQVNQETQVKKYVFKCSHKYTKSAFTVSFAFKYIFFVAQR